MQRHDLGLRRTSGTGFPLSIRELTVLERTAMPAAETESQTESVTFTSWSESHGDAEDGAFVRISSNMLSTLILPTAIAELVAFASKSTPPLARQMRSSLVPQMAALTSVMKSS